MMHLLPLRRRRRQSSSDQQSARPVLISRDEAAKAASVCGRTVSRAIDLWQSSGGRYGLRPAVRRHGLLRIDVADLNAWIAAGCPTGAHAAIRCGSR